jgi:hypothetical protein
MKNIITQAVVAVVILVVAYYLIDIIANKI